MAARPGRLVGMAGLRLRGWRVLVARLRRDVLPGVLQGLARAAAKNYVLAHASTTLAARPGMASHTNTT